RSSGQPFARAAQPQENEGPRPGSFHGSESLRLHHRLTSAARRLHRLPDQSGLHHAAVHHHDGEFPAADLCLLDGPRHLHHAADDQSRGVAMASIIRFATNPEIMVAALVSIAVFATVLTLLPSTGGPSLKSRMKSVALERDGLRARQKARLAAEAERNRGKSLRRQDTSGVRRIVERLDLRRALADEKTAAQLRNAGFRSESAMTRFLFLRFVLPFLGASLIFLWIYFG